jgi:hypothetical protein
MEVVEKERKGGREKREEGGRQGEKHSSPVAAHRHDVEACRMEEGWRPSGGRQRERVGGPESE